MEQTDLELLTEYRRGHTRALEQLVDRYEHMLYGYIVNLTQSRNDADDIYQEVWIRVIRKLGRYRHRNFGGWLVRIARNIVIDRSRKRKPDFSLDQQDEAGRGAADTLAGDVPEPSQQVEAGETGTRIALAVRQLPPEQRDVFLMRVHGDLPFKEIARVQKTSINTVLARMQYALKKLRGMLEDEYDAVTDRG